MWYFTSRYEIEPTIICDTLIPTSFLSAEKNQLVVEVSVLSDKCSWCYNDRQKGACNSNNPAQDLKSLKKQT